MTLTDVLEHLAAKCYAAGGQAKWAAANGLSPSFVSAVLQRRKPPSDKVLDALGLEKVERVTYRRKKERKDG